MTYPKDLHPLVARQWADLKAGRMSRRAFLTRATALGLGAQAALSLVDPVAAQEAQAAPTGSVGASIRIAQTVLPLKDPRTVDWPQIANITRGWLEYLVELTPDGRLRGMLLDRWEVSEDASLYRLVLRDGVTWQDGSPLSADQIAWLFGYWADGTVDGNSMAARVAGLQDPGTKALRRDAVRVVDTRTLEISLAKPDATFIANLADYPAAVVHPSFDPSRDATSLGTGPYTLSALEPGTSATLVRAPDHVWWGQTAEGFGGAQLSRIDFIDLGTDPASWIDGLDQGEVDMLYENTGAFIDVADAKGYVRQSVETAATVVLRGNQMAEVEGIRLYGERATREAMARAISNDVLLELGQGGRGILGANDHVAPLQPDFASLGPTGTNPSAARGLMRDIGLGSFVHEIVTLDDGLTRNTGAAAVAQLTDAGINATQSILSGPDFWGAWRDHPLSITEWNHRPLGIQTLALAYRSDSAWNETGFADADFDATLDQALATPDAATRRPFMEQLQSRLREEFVIIQPYWREITRHHRGDVTGAEMHPTFEIHLYKLGRTA